MPDTHEPTDQSDPPVTAAPPQTVRTTDVNEQGLRMMLPMETYRMTNTHAYLCVECGALVIDVGRHEKWHATEALKHAGSPRHSHDLEDLGP